MFKLLSKSKVDILRKIGVITKKLKMKESILGVISRANILKDMRWMFPNLSLRKQIIMLVGSLIATALLAVGSLTFFIVQDDYNNIVDNLIKEKVLAVKEKITIIWANTNSNDFDRQFRFMISNQKKDMEELGYSPQILVIGDSEIVRADGDVKVLSPKNIKKIERERSGNALIETENGRYFFTYEHLLEPGWIYMLGISEKEYYRTLFELRDILIGISIITLALVFFIANITAKGVVVPLEKIAYSVNKAEEGYLNVRAEETGDPITRKLAKDFNNMMDKKRGVISEFMNSTNYIVDNDKELSEKFLIMEKKTDDLNKSISCVREEAHERMKTNSKIVGLAQSSLENVFSIEEKANISVKSSKSLITKANLGQELLNDLVDLSDSIKESIQKNNDGMENLKEKSKRIEGIVDSINDIADKTQLLSLNARIEAARAGEYGMGFSVVAEEVTKLAYESKSAVENVKKLIDETTEHIGKTYDTNFSAYGEVNSSFVIIDTLKSDFENILESINENDLEVRDIFEELKMIKKGANEIDYELRNSEEIHKANLKSFEEISETSKYQKNLSIVVKKILEKLRVNAEGLDNDMRYFKM